MRDAQRSPPSNDGGGIAMDEATDTMHGLSRDAAAELPATAAATATCHSHRRAHPSAVSPKRQPAMLDVTADRLQQQHAYLEDGVAHALRRAGAGPDLVLERRLMGQAKLLQAMLSDRSAAQAVADVAEAARRVMDAAEPEAPVRMLALARENLARLVRRHALMLPRDRRVA
ncbi:hypothetical protein [Lysobacter sp. HA18]